MKTYRRADIIVASSVFTHLDNPHAFIEAVKKLLTDDGSFIIEVEYIGNILRHIQFERFYLDRIFYYSLTSLAHLFDAHGLLVTDVAHIEPHGGSLQVTIQRKSAGRMVSDHVKSLLNEESESLTVSKLAEFKANVEIQIAALQGSACAPQDGRPEDRRIRRAGARIDDLQLRKDRAGFDRIHRGR